MKKFKANGTPLFLQISLFSNRWRGGKPKNSFPLLKGQDQNRLPRFKVNLYNTVFQALRPGRLEQSHSFINRASVRFCLFFSYTMLFGTIEIVPYKIIQKWLKILKKKVVKNMIVFVNKLAFRESICERFRPPFHLITKIMVFQFLSSPSLAL